MKFLAFMNLLDESGNAISLTNLGLWAIMVKILISPMIDGPSVVALVSLLVNYMHKRNAVSKDSNNDRQSS